MIGLTLLPTAEHAGLFCLFDSLIYVHDQQLSSYRDDQFLLHSFHLDYDLIVQISGLKKEMLIELL